jgi:hypothetical protein
MCSRELGRHVDGLSNTGQMLLDDGHKEMSVGYATIYKAAGGYNPLKDAV